MTNRTYITIEDTERRTAMLDELFDAHESTFVTNRSAMPKDLILIEDARVVEVAGIASFDAPAVLTEAFPDDKIPSTGSLEKAGDGTQWVVFGWGSTYHILSTAGREIVSRYAERDLGPAPSIGDWLRREDALCHAEPGYAKILADARKDSLSAADPDAEIHHAKKLPAGWLWINYPGTSGRLESPTHYAFFRYDLTGPEGTILHTEMDSIWGYASEGEGITFWGTLDEFKEFAESRILAMLADCTNGNGDDGCGLKIDCDDDIDFDLLFNESDDECDDNFECVIDGCDVYDITSAE